MTSKLFQLACPALVALALCIRAGAAEPTIVAPESVPVGGLAMVRVDGLEADAKFSWTAVPPVQTADLMQRDGTPVLFVSTAVAGKHWIILAYLDGGEVRQQTTTLTIGGGPPVPVPPGPVPPDPLPPGPSGLRVLILRETADPIPPVVASTQVRAYLNSHAAKGADGQTPEWRIWDDDYVTENLEHLSDNWRAAYADAKQRSAGSLPWIHVSNGREGYSGPLPATVEDTLTLLRKYGGD